MKTCTYSINIQKPQDVVFSILTDPEHYPAWGNAWGEGMRMLADWREGGTVTFLDPLQGGTRAVIEEWVPDQLIRTRHTAMVTPENDVIDAMDDEMRKWIGSQENYRFSPDGNGGTLLEVEMLMDEAFEEMMAAWTIALQQLKGLCEAKV